MRLTTYELLVTVQNLKVSFLKTLKLQHKVANMAIPGECTFSPFDIPESPKPT